MNELEAMVSGSGYKYEKLANDIYLLHDFLTEEERLAYYNLASSTSESNWSVFYLKGLEKQGVYDHNRKDIATLIEEGLLSITPGWIDKALSIDSLQPIPDNVTARVQMLSPEGKYQARSGVIQRHYPRTNLDEHRDTDYEPNLKYTLVAYINDDYNGGEISFSDFEVKIKPPARSAILFSAVHLHEVCEVAPGPHRYVAPVFLFSKDENGQ